MNGNMSNLITYRRGDVRLNCFMTFSRSKMCIEVCAYVDDVSTGASNGIASVIVEEASMSTEFGMRETFKDIPRKLMDIYFGV